MRGMVLPEIAVEAFPAPVTQGHRERKRPGVPATRSPGANEANAKLTKVAGNGEARVPATLRRRTQKFGRGPGGTKSPETLYSAHNLSPAFVLHYDWTGWPTAGTTLPPQSAIVARETAPSWEKDGLRLLEPHARLKRCRFYSASPRR